MRPRVIDSNILLALWHGRFPSPTKVKVRTQPTAKLVAEAWLKICPGDGVLTPIRLELVGGGLDRDAVRLTDYFLDLFPLFDGGDVRREDWDAASRLARCRGLPNSRHLPATSAGPGDPRHGRPPGLTAAVRNMVAGPAARPVDYRW